MTNIFLTLAQAKNLGPEYAFGDLTSVAEGVANLMPIAFSVAGTALVIYLIIGGYKYLTSAGDKGSLDFARSMITHAIIGFILLLMLFIVLEVLPSIIGLKNYSVIKF